MTRNNKPIDYANAHVSPSGSRWIVASNPQHYGGLPEVLELHEDCRVTLWEYAGRTCPCIGSSGTLASLKPGTTVKHVTNAKEREMVTHKERLIEKGKEMLDLQYQIAKMHETASQS